MPDPTPESVDPPRESAEKKPRGACPERSRRGGRRPGAGAPKGNFNALKHGRRSQQFAELGALLAASPAIREALLNMGRKQKLKEQKADQIAALLFAQMIARAQELSGGKLFVESPTPDRRSIVLNPLNFAHLVDQIDPKGPRKR